MKSYEYFLGRSVLPVLLGKTILPFLMIDSEMKIDRSPRLLSELLYSDQFLVFLALL